MAQRRSDGFKRDAVRIALTSGQPHKQVAADLGVGVSTLGKWIRLYGDQEKAPEGDQALMRENERLRRELRLVTEGEAGQEMVQWIISPTNEVLKKATAFFAAQKR